MTKHKRRPYLAPLTPHARGLLIEISSKRNLPHKTVIQQALQLLRDTPADSPRHPANRPARGPSSEERARRETERQVEIDRTLRQRRARERYDAKNVNKGVDK